MTFAVRPFAFFSVYNSTGSPWWLVPKGAFSTDNFVSFIDETSAGVARVPLHKSTNIGRTQQGIWLCISRRLRQLEPCFKLKRGFESVPVRGERAWEFGRAR